MPFAVGYIVLFVSKVRKEQLCQLGVSVNVHRLCLCKVSNHNVKRQHVYKEGQSDV